MGLEIIQIGLLRDNYSYLLQDTTTGFTAIVDPSAAEPIVDVLKNHGDRLDLIVNTHHHSDHTVGNCGLKHKYHCDLAASIVRRAADTTIPLKDGDTINFGTFTARVLATPGHTADHVVFWICEARALFCGDLLFSLSCGNVFEGSTRQMCESLHRIYQLPDSTQIYCGHEYTHLFTRFARQIDPQNQELIEKEKRVQKLHEQGKPTIPSLLGEEKRLNPYLRIFDRSFARLLGQEDANPVALFEYLSRLDS